MRPIARRIATTVLGCALLSIAMVPPAAAEQPQNATTLQQKMAAERKAKNDEYKSAFVQELEEEAGDMWYDLHADSASLYELREYLNNPDRQLDEHSSIYNTRYYQEAGKRFISRAGPDAALKLFPLLDRGVQRFESWKDEVRKENTTVHRGPLRGLGLDAQFGSNPLGVTYDKEFKGFRMSGEVFTDPTDLGNLEGAFEARVYFDFDMGRFFKDDSRMQEKARMSPLRFSVGYDRAPVSTINYHISF